MRICREIVNAAIYALYPESFCGKDLAIRKVFAFSDSVAQIRVGKFECNLCQRICRIYSSELVICSRTEDRKLRCCTIGRSAAGEKL